MKIGLRVVGLAATLGVALAGCGDGATREGAAQPPAQSGAGPAGRGGAGRLPVVGTVPVERGSIARPVTVAGVIEPIRSVAVNSQLSGALLAVHVEEGHEVRRGQVLARLDDRELRAQLAAAEAGFQVAQAAYERAEQLRERRVITIPEYERERTAYAAATAQLDQLRTRIAYALIGAPITGVVTEKRVEAGDVVAPQTRLFTLADVSVLVVKVGVSELDVVELREGDATSLALDAFPGRAFRGRIRRIFPSADPTTRLVPVEVALGGEEAQVARPGFLARVTFALGARENVVLVPASAVLAGQESQTVFVIEGEKAVRRVVRTGLTSAGRVEILSGLEAGEVVVTIGNHLLRDGMEVRVVSGNGAGSTGGAPDSATPVNHGSTAR